MRVRLFILVLVLALASIAEAVEPRKPTLVVESFSLHAGVVWPYNMDELRFKTLGELMQKDGQYFFVVPEPASDAKGTVYTLRGEVLEWHPGNKAKRIIVGMGSGRETAKIHYWLTDASGKKIFDHTDTIRTVFLGNAYASSVGQLAQPFAEKIAERLKAAKLTEVPTSSEAEQSGPKPKPNN